MRRTRAQRRKFLAKAFSKARTIVRSWNIKEPEEKSRKRACILRDNRQACSCHMCGNPRRNNRLKLHDRLTLAEQKFLLKDP